MSFHRDLRGEDLHPSKIDGYEGSPIGNVIPEYIGQPIIDTLNKTYYLSYGLTSNDWEIIGASGGGLVLSAAQDVDSTDRADKTILEWDEASQTHVYIPDMQGKSSGITGNAPTFTDNGDGSLTISASEVVLYSNAFQQDKPKNYSIASETFTLTQDITNYIVVDYNAGTPIYNLITDVNIINESSIIPVITAFRSNNDIYAINWDSLADGLTNKLHERFVKTDRFGHEVGITLTESAGRIANTTSGRVWYGAVRTDIPSFTSATDWWSFWYHSAGEWVEDKTTTTYNNTQYDDGTNLVTAGNNRFLVNWVFRCACQPSRGAYVLGTADYASIAEAQEAEIPELPPLLNSLMFVVGRIIVKKNDETASTIDTAFVGDFAATAITIHNNLGGLNDGDFQHLTANEYNKIKSTYTEKTEDYNIAVTDHTIGVICSTISITINLFSASDLPGKVINIKKLDNTGLAVVVTPQSGETIDGSSSKIIDSQWSSMTLQSTGTNWIII